MALVKCPNCGHSIPDKILPYHSLKCQPPEDTIVANVHPLHQPRRGKIPDQPAPEDSNGFQDVDNAILDRIEGMKKRSEKQSLSSKNLGRTFSEEELGLESLPTDILQHIFSFLSTQTLIEVVPLVCKEWKDTSEDPQLWSSLPVIPGDTKPEFVRWWLEKRCQYVYKLEIVSLDTNGDSVLHVVADCTFAEKLRTLETFTVGRQCTSPTISKFFRHKDAFLNLTHVNLSESSADDDAVENIRAAAPSIHTLDVSGLSLTDAVVDSLRKLPLRHLNISRNTRLSTASVWDLVGGVSDTLEYLCVSSLHLEDEFTMRSCSRHMEKAKLLSSLAVVMQEEVGHTSNNAALFQFLRPLPSLASVELRNFNGGTHFAHVLDLPHLHTMSFYNPSHGVSELSISRCPAHLELKGISYIDTLNLSGSLAMTTLSYSTLRSLTSLDLSHTSFSSPFIWSTSRGPNLKTVNLSHSKCREINMDSCRRLTDLEANYCPELGSVVLTQCTSLSSLSLHGSAITHLDIRWCRSLKSGVASSLDGSRLRCLLLANAIGLSDKEVASFCQLYLPHCTIVDLSYLTKVNDAMLLSLGERCPSLEQLKIYHCRSVTGLSLLSMCSLCSNMTVIDASWCPKVRAVDVREVEKCGVQVKKSRTAQPRS